MRFRGILHRAHNPQWMWPPDSGEGAKRHGGRFNRKGVAAFYASLSPMTAIHEASPLGRPMHPLTVCAYEVDADPVFDALDPAQRRTQSVTAGELACPDWERQMLNRRTPASHHLAERLVAAGFVGMRTPSFAHHATADDINFVFWLWGSRRPCRIVLIDPEHRLRRLAQLTTG